jgi:hypothetical protein
MNKRIAVLLIFLWVNYGFGYNWPFSESSSQHGPITGTLGEYRGTHLHEGVDIVKTKGTVIYHVIPAKSYVSKEIGGWGEDRSISVVTYNSTYTYWHVKNTYEYKKGDEIPAGAAIATVGDYLNDGKAGNDHLHFEENDGGANPLRSGGLTPFSDNAPPVVEKIAFVKNITEETYPTVDGVTVLSGEVDIKAWAYDPRINADGSAGGKGVGIYKIGYEILNEAGSVVKSAVYNYQFDSVTDKSVSWIYASSSSYVPVNFIYLNFIYWVTNNGNSNNCWDTTSINDGRYKIKVIAQDIKGNTGSLTSNVVIVDNNAPTISNFTPSWNSYTNNRRPTISATYSDAGVDTATVVLKLDSNTVFWQNIFETGASSTLSSG